MKFITTQDIKISYFKEIINTLSIDENLQKILIDNLKKLLHELPNENFDRGDAHRLRVIFETLLHLMFIGKNQGSSYSKKHVNIAEKIKLITDRYTDSQAHNMYTHLSILKGYGNIFSHSEVEPNSKLMIFGALASVYKVLVFLQRNTTSKQMPVKVNHNNNNSKTKPVVQVNKNNQNKHKQVIQKSDEQKKNNKVNVNKSKRNTSSPQTKVKK